MSKSIVDHVEKLQHDEFTVSDRVTLASNQSVELDDSLSNEAKEHLVSVVYFPKSGTTADIIFPQERKLLRKLDFKLIPWLCLLYLVSFLDRTNIGNAKIFGLQKDLQMTNGQYNAALCIFFVYVLCRNRLEIRHCLLQLDHIRSSSQRATSCLSDYGPASTFRACK